MPAITTPEDLAQFYDIRDIRELVVDDGGDVSTLDITMDPIVLTHLSSAEARVRGYLAKNGRYTDADIDAIVEDEENENDLAWLKEIISRFAMHSLLMRRPRFDTAVLDASQRLVDNLIKSLQDGDALMGVDDQELEAGRASVDGPSVSESQANNWWVDRAPYFPHRTHRRGRNN